MKKRRLYYMGSFPPPYGGVTVKNKLLYSVLKEKIEIHAKQKFTLLSTIEALLFGNQYILAAGSTEKLLALTTILYYFRPKAMSVSIVFAMGGNLADFVDEKPVMIKMLQRYRHIYVEPTGMMNRLKKKGLKNLSLLPNCRVTPETNYEVLPHYDGNLRCTFFSRVSPDKGVDVVLKAAEKLYNVEFHLYGEIDANYKETFLNKIYSLKNVTYHGVFKARGSEVYDELATYDAILLPTRWKFEGIPGVLVESKIAGIPSIVSDICYNDEIVENGVSGIVLKENTVSALVEAIEYLDNNRDELYKLKVGAKQSAEVYYIENYINGIIDKLREIIIA